MENIIYKVRPDKAVLMSVLLTLHLWDSMTPEEREALTERGEVWDTVPGRAFRKSMEAA